MYLFFVVQKIYEPTPVGLVRFVRPERSQVVVDLIEGIVENEE